MATTDLGTSRCRTGMGPVAITGEKAAELDFGFACEELRTRMAFTKSVLQLQFTVYGGLLISGKIVGHLRPLAIVGLVVNYIFLHEIVKNVMHVRLAAAYISRVVNKRYSVPVCQWEMFLAVARFRSGRVHDRFLHALDSSLLTPLVAGTACVVVFVWSTIGSPWPAPLFLTAESLAVACLVGLHACELLAHQRGRKAFASLFAEQDLREFAATYDLPFAERS